MAADDHRQTSTVRFSKISGTAFAKGKLLERGKRRIFLNQINETNDTISGYVSEMNYLGCSWDDTRMSLNNIEYMLLPDLGSNMHNPFAVVHVYNHSRTSLILAI